MISIIQKTVIITFLVFAVHALSILKEETHLRSRATLHQAYKDNLIVQNWYYGNMNPVQYRIRLFEIEAKEKTYPCPLETPFANQQMNGCEYCPEDTPLRNIQTFVCEKCPEGQEFDIQLGNCTKVAFTTEPSIQNSSTSNTTSTSDISSAQGQNSPYFEPIVVTPPSTTNNNETTPQQSSQINNITEQEQEQNKNRSESQSTPKQNRTLEEESPSNSTIQNTTVPMKQNNQTNIIEESSSTNETEQKNESNITIEENSQNKSEVVTEVENQTIEPQNQKQVKNETNISEEKSQIAQNQRTEITENVAQTETSEQINSTASETTPSTGTEQKQQNETVTEIAQEKENNQTNKMQQYTPRSSIQISLQNLTGTKTHNCPAQTPFFNLTTKQCEKCPQNEEFQNISNKCLPFLYTYNKEAKNLILPTKDYLDKYDASLRFANPTRKLTECPTDKPYSKTIKNGSSSIYECVSCQEGWYYAAVTEECMKTCPLGTTYSESEHICTDGEFYINPNATGLLFKTQDKYKEWDHSNRLRKQNNPKAEYCPIETPYLSFGKCIKCEGDNYLYDVEMDQCSQCGRGREYNEEKKTCVSTGFTDAASLQRMIANIY